MSRGGKHIDGLALAKHIDGLALALALDSLEIRTTYFSRLHAHAKNDVG